eukprot:7584169-Ditylum_brightwellii.AAC.1
MPREGHLGQIFHIFTYLKKLHNTEIVYDPSDPCIETGNFEQKDWTSSEFGHISGEERLPPKLPEPGGLDFIMSAKVDADHAADMCFEYLRSLRYKLRMMGIPCEGPAYIAVNNQSVLANMTVLDSTLKKKSQ